MVTGSRQRRRAGYLSQHRLEQRGRDRRVDQWRAEFRHPRIRHEFLAREIFTGLCRGGGTMCCLSETDF